MSVFSALAIYFILWWLSLLIVLPFGERTQEEAGEVSSGTVPSAPANPMVLRRLVAATVLAAIFLAIYYGIQAADLVRLDDFTLFDPPSVRAAD